jgi:K+-sensing histidine kinase KdpD
MESIKQAHPYSKKILLISYIISIFCILLFFYTNNINYIITSLICLIILGITYYILQKREKKQFNYLIKCSDYIIDQKDFEIIDGEGVIPILSHKLFILNKRYKTLLTKNTQEQIKLKNYIEDISHQIKTPITSMRINIELLLEEDNKHQNKLKSIYKQILKINQLVDSLLTLALFDSHSIQLKYEDYPIELLIDNIEIELSYLLEKNNMSINLMNNKILSIDKKWMEEALKNIIKNFIENNSNSSIDISINESDAIYTICIKDYGKGFIKEDIPHLFERFYRGKNNDKKGIGIGLALAYEIIKCHHGTINAYNQDGALIIITLPKINAKKKYNFTKY